MLFVSVLVDVYCLFLVFAICRCVVVGVGCWLLCVCVALRVTVFVVCCSLLLGVWYWLVVVCGALFVA